MKVFDMTQAKISSHVESLLSNLPFSSLRKRANLYFYKIDSTVTILNYVNEEN